ncbi:MAG: SMC-Scp complex subunit ScpB [Candidatus Solibacter usitatus]|nr:SMC-Scp complex subunit ScpB [Candidatus Solibacter usitatus]
MDSSEENNIEETQGIVDTATLLAASVQDQQSAESVEESTLSALIEAVIYVTEEPLTLEQIATALDQPKDRVELALAQLMESYSKPGRGVSVREVAGGFRMGTKPEHHEAIRAFVKKLRPPFKLSLAALETLAVIAYKQPITTPEIMEVRGVQGAGVVKTLLDRKLIVPAGRKQVVGKPILYRTTREFLLQFGLKDLSELPTLKEFEELRRIAIPDDELLPVAETEAATVTAASE